MEDDGDDGSLFAAGVLATLDEEVTTSERFEAAVEGYVAEVAGRSADGREELVRERVDRESVVEPFAALGGEDPRTLAELCALHDALEPASDDDWLPLLPALRLFRPVETPTDGAPEAFVPVPATHVPFLSRIYTPTLVYVWLHDCEPCEAVKRDLEGLFERPREVLPLAVFGPDGKEFLADEYDVTAGPALLFMRDGAVESRLYGAHGRRVVETELGRLVDGS